MSTHPLAPGRPSRSRQLTTTFLALAGLVLAGLAVLDWVGYTAFSVSLTWR